MYSYYTTTYNSRTIHIIKAQSDAAHDVCISIMADRFDSANTKKLISNFGDSYLESNGFSKVGAINGSLFFQLGSYFYANGIEKAFWTVNENDDSSYDGVMGIAHNGDASNTPIISLQSSMKANLGSYRGAITGAFGLLQGGSVIQGNTSLLGDYSASRGRSIVGKDNSGAIYFIAIADTGGLTGSQCVGLVQSLGLSDAVALDGGGSTGLIYEGSWKVNTSRLVKNAIGLYVKAKSDPGGGVTPPAAFRVSDGYVPMFGKRMPHLIKVNNVLVPIKEIQVKTPNGLVAINELVNPVIEVPYQEFSFNLANIVAQDDGQNLDVVMNTHGTLRMELHNFNFFPETNIYWYKNNLYSTAFSFENWVNQTIAVVSGDTIRVRVVGMINGAQGTIRIYNHTNNYLIDEFTVFIAQ